MYIKSETWANDCVKVFNEKYDEKKFSAKFASVSINKGARMEQVEIKGSHHKTQTDFAILTPIENAIERGGFYPIDKFKETHLIGNHVAAEFLVRIGILGCGKTPAALESRKMKQRIVHYAKDFDYLKYLHKLK